MTHRPLSSRKFLTFPAIRPCSGVSSAALLSDLLSISGDINSFEPSDFTAHRRAIRESVRYSAIILSFIEELIPVASSLARSVLVALSDLHVALQKLRFLLSDCSRHGARLWLLLNAARVAANFRFLLRAVAGSLGIVPLEDLRVSDDVKELVKLLVRQGRRVEIEVELLDEIQVKSVRSMINGFQSGESPERNDLRRVLNHIKISSWSDCCAEVLFLEEIFAEEEIGEEKVELLWSSFGLMIYSLVVIFDEKMNVKGRKMKFLGQNLVVVEKMNGEDLRCPISLELMKDPVTVSTGQTFDRSSILRWLKNGNNTCPVTGETLSTADFVPNSNVKQLINLYCCQNAIFPPQNCKAKNKDLSKTLSPASPAAIAAIRMAATFLVAKLSTGELEEKQIAAYEIRMLSKSNTFNRICLVEAGAISRLLCFLSSLSDPSLQDNAIASLLNLSKHHSGRTDIFEDGGIPQIVQLMKSGHKVEARKNAAAVLFYLSSTEICREAIGETPEAVSLLVELLKNGTFRGKKNAIVTIYGLLLFPANQAKILACNTVSVIARLLESEDEEEELVTDCIGVLAKIAERRDGTNEILKSGVISNLLHLMQGLSSSSGREYCLSVLLSVCKNGGDKAMNSFEKMPSLMPLLYSTLSDGSRQASKKARLLLNCIHQFDDQRYSPVLSVHDHFVHVL